MIKIIDTVGNSLAFINNAINPVIREVINGEYTLSFSTLIEELKSDYINQNNLIEVDNQLFQIATYRKERTRDNKLLVDVIAEHISYSLLDEYVDSFIYSNSSPLTMLTDLLNGTGFLLRNVNVGGTNSIEILERTNKRDILNQIGNLFGGEFVFDNYYIDFLVQRGENRGVEFRPGKNILGIRKTVDKTKKDQDGNPSVTYEISAIELNEMEEFKGLEGFKIGDSAKVIDEELDVNITARILEYEYNPIMKVNSQIVFGNFIENIINSNTSLISTSNLVSKRASIWDRAKAISENGTFFSELIEGEINTLQNTVRAGLGSVTITDNNGILITDQPTMEASTKAIRLLGGVLAISNQKDVNGNFIYRTFGDGDGFVADYLIAGVINTDQISLQSADGKLNIVTNSITIEHLDGSKSILNANGLKVEHKIDDYSLFNANGFFRVIDGEQLEYISAMRVGTTETADSNWNGGGSSTTKYKIELRGKRWENTASKLDVVLTKLQFRAPLPEGMSWALGYVHENSGNIDSVLKVYSITNVTNGVDVIIESSDYVGVSNFGWSWSKVNFGYSIVLNG